MMLDRLFHQSARWKIQGGNCSCSFYLSSYAYEGPTPRLKLPGLSRQTIVHAAALAGIDQIEHPSHVTCMIVHTLAVDSSLPESLPYADTVGTQSASIAHSQVLIVSVSFVVSFSSRH
jgi:hypothetical protein